MGLPLIGRGRQGVGWVSLPQEQDHGLPPAKHAGAPAGCLQVLLADEPLGCSPAQPCPAAARTPRRSPPSQRRTGGAPGAQPRGVTPRTPASPPAPRRDASRARPRESRTSSAIEQSRNIVKLGTRSESLPGSLSRMSTPSARRRGEGWGVGPSRRSERHPPQPGHGRARPGHLGRRSALPPQRHASRSSHRNGRVRPGQDTGTIALHRPAPRPTLSP